MKTLSFIFCLFIITSCNDNLRTRKASQALIGEKLTSSSGETVRKMYIAEVSIPVKVGQTQLVFLEASQDIDSDYEYICDIDVSARKQFKYLIQDNELILKDGISTLIFKRINSSEENQLMGSWMMKETKKNVITVTEIIFNTLEDIKIRKTCNLL